MPKEKENIKGKTNDESSGTTRAENSKKQAREDPNTPMDAHQIVDQKLFPRG